MALADGKGLQCKYEYKQEAETWKHKTEVVMSLNQLSFLLINHRYSVHSFYIRNAHGNVQSYNRLGPFHIPSTVQTGKM